jgi:hypothetical protein
MAAKKGEKRHNFLPSHHRRSQFATTKLSQDFVPPSQKFDGQNESGLAPYHMRNLNRTIKENQEKRGRAKAGNLK